MAKIAGFISLVSLLLAFSCDGQRSWAASDDVEVVGTEFHLLTEDGRTFRPAELVGAILTVATNGTTVRVRIDGVEPDPGDPARGYKPAADVWLYSFSVQQADGSWINLCVPGPDGRRQGFPLDGVSGADGTIAPAAPGQFVLTCTGGAEGKCIRFGYRPWDRAPDGQSLARAYQTCVHLVRADYAGDGTATTRNGQPIDIYDSLGVQAPANDPGQDFEAGWGPDGAVCVRHVRVKENMTLEALAAHTPRLDGRVGAICTEEYARSLGAIMFDRSAP